MRLIFATNNFHKLSEIKDILGVKFRDIVFSMSDLNIHLDPVESGSTFDENSYIKSSALYNAMKNNNMLKTNDYIIADDTGLCIDFLDGAPGIMSARFMGKDTNQDMKNKQIILLMKDVKNEERTAYFITSLSVLEIKNPYDLPKKMFFEGRINGYIAKSIEKTDGFGYDPIFAVGNPNDIEKGQVKTYSNLGIQEKNKISHRAIALLKFVQYLAKDHNI